MAIRDRDAVRPGVTLTANYKGDTYLCEVVADPQGRPRFTLEDGSIFNSVSGAARAVRRARMDGHFDNTNGWQFWSIANERIGGKPQRSERQADAQTGVNLAARKARPAARAARQRGVAATMTGDGDVLLKIGQEPVAIFSARPEHGDAEFVSVGRWGFVRDGEGLFVQLA